MQSLSNFFQDQSVEAQEFSRHLQILEDTFSKPIRLDEPRDIFPVYRSLNYVTDIVAKLAISELTNEWEEILLSLHGRKITNIGFSYTSFDTSLAREVLKKGLSSIKSEISYKTLDLSVKKNLTKALDFISDRADDAFGLTMPRGFFERVFSTEGLTCLVCTDSQEQIIGILYGFFAEDELKRKIFYAMELSRKATHAELEIGKGLINYARSKQVEYPDLKFAALDVEASNPALKIYEKEQFQKHSGEDGTLFMIQPLTTEEQAPLSPTLSDDLTISFIFKACPFPILVYYALVIQCNHLWRSFWYR